ncbi:MEDS domain-containing protein [Massilia sp. IC2-476]|uniref:hybrid sensor histidine kinase/response regulator n=1 Tax=Massilia sp. IC2-476 TaxID=2887199 RepID=UPI001D128C59|nr:MEDS domain-containing protein [Massilia sp. IC2-476]MCC2974108.1 MEDS domain-containing protein [Massilia sp. IC2-476]
MSDTIRASGIDAVGDIPWGSHFCQFYREEQDLVETLVPFFTTGLAANESCLWVTSKALDADKAKSLLSRAVPDLNGYLRSGQLEVVSISDWYQASNGFEQDEVLASWLEREARSHEQGFAGLRLTGDTSWVERSGWDDFMAYESRVNGAFNRRKLVALCTYCLDNCSPSDVLDVCRHHQFALARRDGDWELLESSSLKVAKDRLLRMNGELEERVAARTAALNQALHARDEFLAMLGHELRNPLAPIRSAAELIQTAAPAGSAIADSAAVLTRQAGHLTRLVNDLLDAARVTQGQIQIERAPVSLAGIIDTAVEQSRALIDQRGHSLSVGVPGRAVHVHADATRLAQVFGNLLNNAAKYTPDGGEVSIGAQVRDGMATIRVTDNGTGIPAPMLDSIFDLFTQLPRSLARSDGGLGVGLTLARRIVDMHEGTISAESAGSDQGSTFTVRIPVCEAPGQARSAAPEPRHTGLPGRRILVVDDNGDAREMMASLISLHGHEVSTAEDGASAVEQARLLAPDLVIMDIGLPDMDGYEAARRIRSLGLSTAPRLVALTGYGQPSDLALAQAAGFDAHLLKPAAFEDVMATVVRLTAQ